MRRSKAGIRTPNWLWRTWWLVGEAQRQDGNEGGVVPILLVTGHLSRAPKHSESVSMKLAPTGKGTTRIHMGPDKELGDVSAARRASQ